MTPTPNWEQPDPDQPDFKYALLPDGRALEVNWMDGMGRDPLWGCVDHLVALIDTNGDYVDEFTIDALPSHDVAIRVATVLWLAFCEQFPA